MLFLICGMNITVSDDIKKRFALPLVIELQDHKEKVFHNALVSSIDIKAVRRRQSGRSGHGRTRIRYIPFKLNRLTLSKNMKAIV